MPFTPTHILAILPVAVIKRPWLPFSALVIGSMIPDLPLFVPLGPGYGTTHSPAGLLTACLPLGLICFLVFQTLMKRPLFALLPVAIQERCGSLARPCIESTVRFFAGASLAIVIGATSHVVWDSFTHSGRWGTLFFPALNEKALTIAGQALPWFKVLQYGCTLIGLPVLGLLLAFWLYRRRPEPLGERERILSAPSKFTAYSVAVLMPLSAAIFVWRQDDESRYNRLSQSITSSGLALILVTLAYCVVFWGIESCHVRGKLRSPSD